MPNSKMLKSAVEELAKRVQQGDDLAMDYASRMQRAKDMGFDIDTVYYHGTPKDFDAFTHESIGDRFDRYSFGTYMTDDPNIANEYTKESGQILDGGNVKQILKKKPSNPLDIEMTGYNPAAYIDLNRGELIEKVVESRRAGNPIDQINVKNTNKDNTVSVLFDQENIRSVNAAFDPAKKSSANLLASKGAGFVPVGGALAVGAGLTPEEAMAEQVKSEYLHGIGGPLEHKIEAPSSPLLYSLADKIGQADRATRNHPANILIPTGVADWATKAAYDEADLEDRIWAALDLL